MSHKQQKDFITQISSSFKQYFNNSTVLEVGSLDINGSIRSFFNSCDYIGLDVASGKGVDVVCQGQEYSADNESFDHVISCEAMEHNPYWKETFENMIRLCKKDGLVTFTCATTGRREHGTSKRHPGSSPLTVDIGWDYYQNLDSGDFKKEFQLDELFSHYHFWSNWSSFDIYFCGIKKGDGAVSTKEWKEMVKAVDRVVSIDNKTRLAIYRKVMATSLGDRWFDLMRFTAKKLKIKKLSLIHGDW